MRGSKHALQNHGFGFSEPKALEKNSLRHSAIPNCGWAHPFLISREIKSICFSFIYTQLTEMLFGKAVGVQEAARAASEPCCSQLGSGLASVLLEQLLCLPHGIHKAPATLELAEVNVQLCEGSGGSNGPVPCLRTDPDLEFLFLQLRLSLMVILFLWSIIFPFRKFLQERLLYCSGMLLTQHPDPLGLRFFSTPHFLHGLLPMASLRAARGSPWALELAVLSPGISISEDRPSTLSAEPEQEDVFGTPEPSCLMSHLQPACFQLKWNSSNCGDIEQRSSPR